MKLETTIEETAQARSQDELQPAETDQAGLREQTRQESAASPAPPAAGSTGEMEENGELTDGRANGDPRLPPRLPYSFSRNHGLLLEQRGEQLILLHREGELRLELLGEVCRYIQAPLDGLEKVSGQQFQTSLTRAHQKDDSEAARAAADLDADQDLSRLAEEIPDATDLMEGDDDAPVVRLINAVLSQAVRAHASDIHIETFEDNVSVRFRVDGVLHDILSPNRRLAPLLVSRLKVMAKLDIAEKRVPQDGRISVRIAGHAVDIRLSTIPSAHGERVVLRLLDTEGGRLSVQQLGMREQAHNNFLKVLHAPHGIILVTGPTGSGKTTSLYAGITEINESSRNIMTIEDPVEYMLEGIAQTQVNTKVGMSFARGLRAILRQDPDVVMIGEIRDLETAEIAVQASLTGHLVLSTLHTNTAIGAITRLQDMGVESFLLSSSLVAMIAQRLVRRLCVECREPYQPGKSELERLQLEPKKDLVLHRAKGCEKCNGLGYRGRTGIYELLLMDETLKEMINKGTGEQEMGRYAHQHADSIIQDGVQRVLNGETTLEELLRVTLH